MKKNPFVFVPLLALLALLSPALVETAHAVAAGASVNATAATPTAAESIALLRSKDRAHQEIDRRVLNLNGLIERVEQMLNLSSGDKASIVATLTAQVNALNALKAEIDADTTAEALKADVKSITDSYRMYALIIPQGAIITAADRIVTVAAKLRLIALKFETRITAAAAAGNDVTAVRELFDAYNANIADASIEAQAAVNGIVTLTPDEGDATKRAANLKALKDARAQIVLAQKDLQEARKDADKIIAALRGMSVSATATTTTSVGQ